MVAARYLVHDGALRHGERTAVACDHAAVTYAELDLRCGRLAGAMAARGVRAGDRVAVFMDESIDAIAAICGVFAAGAVLVPVDARSEAADLASILDDCAAAALITQARLATVAAMALRSACAIRLVVLAGGDQGSISDSCLAFEEAVRRPAPAPVAGDASPLLLLVYPRTAVGLAAPVTLTEADVVRARESPPSGSLVAQVRPLAAARGISGLLNAFAAGATVDLTVGREALPARAAAA